MEIGPVRAPDYSIYTAVDQKAPEIQTDRRELIQAVKAVNKAELFGEDNELTFTSDPLTKKPVIRIVNRTSKEVVRQIPPDYVLHLALDLK